MAVIKKYLSLYCNHLYKPLKLKNMKNLKIVAIVSVVLFFVLHVRFEWVYVMESGGIYTDKGWSLKQYEMIAKWIAFPLTFIYLFKKLK